MSNQQQPQSQRYRDTPFWKAYDGISQAIDHWIGWPSLPKPIGLLVLIGLRNILRQRNLYDTSSLPARDPVQPGPCDRRAERRTADGSYNDLRQPTMGMQAPVRPQHPAVGGVPGIARRPAVAQSADRQP